MTPKVYVIGPVTGIADDNQKAFEEARDAIKGVGYLSVELPHDTIPSGTPWQPAMRQSIRRLMECDVVVFLPGTELSSGASLERKIARGIGMPVYSLEWFLAKARKETSAT